MINEPPIKSPIAELVSRSFSDITRPWITWISSLWSWIKATDTTVGRITASASILTDAATIDTDAGISNTFIVTIDSTGRTLANPTNLVDSAVYNWYIVQGAGGSKTITTFGSKFYWEGGTSPAASWSTAAGKIDKISGQYLQTLDIIWCSFFKGS